MMIYIKNIFAVLLVITCSIQEAPLYSIHKARPVLCPALLSSEKSEKADLESTRASILKVFNSEKDATYKDKLKDVFRQALQTLDQQTINILLTGFGFFVQSRRQYHALHILLSFLIIPDGDALTLEQKHKAIELIKKARLQEDLMTEEYMIPGHTQKKSGKQAAEKRSALAKYKSPVKNKNESAEAAKGSMPIVTIQSIRADTQGIFDVLQHTLKIWDEIQKNGRLNPEQIKAVLCGEGTEAGDIRAIVRLVYIYRQSNIAAAWNMLAGVLNKIEDLDDTLVDISNASENLDIKAEIKTVMKMLYVYGRNKSLREESYEEREDLVLPIIELFILIQPDNNWTNNIFTRLKDEDGFTRLLDAISLEEDELRVEEILNYIIKKLVEASIKDEELYWHLKSLIENYNELNGYEEDLAKGKEIGEKLYNKYMFYKKNFRKNVVSMRLLKKAFANLKASKKDQEEELKEQAEFMKQFLWFCYLILANQKIQKHKLTRGPKHFSDTGRFDAKAVKLSQNELARMLTELFSYEGRVGCSAVFASYLYLIPVIDYIKLQTRRNKRKRKAEIDDIVNPIILEVTKNITVPQRERARKERKAKGCATELLILAMVLVCGGYFLYDFVDWKKAVEGVKAWIHNKTRPAGSGELNNFGNLREDPFVKEYKDNKVRLDDIDADLERLKKERLAFPLDLQRKLARLNKRYQSWYNKPESKKRSEKLSDIYFEMEVAKANNQYKIDSNAAETGRLNRKKQKLLQRQGELEQHMNQPKSEPLEIPSKFESGKLHQNNHDNLLPVPYYSMRPTFQIRIRRSA